MSVKKLLNIGDKLKKARIDKGFKTQREFADFLGLSRSTYSNYENNNRIPDAETMKKISETLDATVEELLGIDVSYEKRPNLKEIREDASMSISQLANVLEIAPGELESYEAGNPAPLSLYLKISIYLDIPLVDIVRHSSYMNTLNGRMMFMSVDSVQAFDNYFKGSIDNETYVEVADFMKKNEGVISERRNKKRIQSLNAAVTELKGLYFYLHCVEEISDEVLLEIMQGEDIKHVLAYVYDKYRSKRDFSKIKEVKWSPFHTKKKLECDSE